MNQARTFDPENRPYTAADANAPEQRMKERQLEGFGERLAKLRRAKGLTQIQLAELLGVTQRVITYYENESGQPPGALLVDLAKALSVTSDELLGLKVVTERTSPKTARLIKRLRRIENLPAADQRAVLKLVDALCESRGVSA